MSMFAGETRHVWDMYGYYSKFEIIIPIQIEAILINFYCTNT